MKKNKIFLFITLILLLLSVSYAAEVSNDTINADDTHTKNVQTSTSTQTVEPEVIKEETDNNKEIKKTAENKTIKTANKIIEVNDFNNLTYAVSDYDNTDVTININSDITLQDCLYLSAPNKKVTINGNGHTIDGNKSYNFLSITKGNQ